MRDDAHLHTPRAARSRLTGVLKHPWVRRCAAACTSREDQQSILYAVITAQHVLSPNRLQPAHPLAPATRRARHGGALDAGRSTWPWSSSSMDSCEPHRAFDHQTDAVGDLHRASGRARTDIPVAPRPGPRRSSCAALAAAKASSRSDRRGQLRGRFRGGPCCVHTIQGL
jgi:hypothetical protein